MLTSFVHSGSIGLLQGKHARYVIIFYLFAQQPGLLHFLGKRSMKTTLFNDYSYNNRNFTGDFNFCFFSWFVIFFNWVNFLEILVGKLSQGLITGTVSKAKSCFVEPLNKGQVRDGQMGRKDQKAGNFLVKWTLQSFVDFVLFFFYFFLSFFLLLKLLSA